MSQILTSTPGGFEAEVILGRLREAGIPAEVRGSGLNIQGAYNRSGSFDVCVEDEHLARAREVLSQSQDVDEDELARLAEEAGREYGAAQD